MSGTTSVYVGGEKISVNNQQFDVKFNKTVQQLEAGLTKAQKALGLYYNENLRLSDAMGRCVEGLSLWQMKLGMWVDETGRARTIAGDYAEGLSRTELELGHYVNALGEVCTRKGELVRKTKEAIQAENEQAEAAQRYREALPNAFTSLLDSAGNLNSILSSMEDLEGGAGRLINTLSGVATSAEVTSQAFNGLRNLQALFTEAKTSLLAFNTALKTSAVSANGLKAAVSAIGGPFTIVAGAIAATLGAVALFKSSTKSTTDKVKAEVDSVAESFELIKKRAKEAGEEIKSLGDVLKYGAFYKEEGDAFDAVARRIDKANARISELQKERKKVEEYANETAKNAGYGANSVYRASADQQEQINKAIEEQRAEIASAQAEYNKVASELINKIREEQTTEEEKANALKKQYQKLLEYAQADEDRALLQNKIKAIDQEIADAKAKELADQRASLEKSLGISLDFSATKTKEVALAEEMNRLRDAYSSGVLKSAEELANAQERLRKKYEDAEAEESRKMEETLKAEQARRASELGIDSLIAQAEQIINDAKTQADILQERESAIVQALQRGEISDDQYNKATEALARIREDVAEQERKDAEEKAKQAKDKTRSELGIDALMDSLKTPAQKYAEQLRKASDALADQQINQDEFNALKNKLDQDLSDKEKELADSENKFKNEKDKTKEDKAQPSKSMEGGSSDLYLALVKNSTASYQSKMQATTDKMYNMQSETLNETKQTNYYLSQLISNGLTNSYGVWS